VSPRAGASPQRQRDPGGTSPQVPTLDSFETRSTIDEATFERAEPALREALIDGQYTLQEAQRGPVIVVLSGLAGIGGRSAIMMRLTTWMDPRFIRVVAFGKRTHEERAHPPAWRYWQALPPRGRVGIFLNAWYNEVLDAGQRDSLDDALLRIRERETMLVADGCRFVKIWLHLGNRELDERLAALDEERTLPKRMLREQREACERYAKRRDLIERLLRETSTAAAPWNIVEGYDGRFRDLTVAGLVRDALHAAHADRAKPRKPVTSRADAAPVETLRQLDLAKRVDDDAYEDELPGLQRRLAALTERKRFGDRSLVLVFEGMDAAGKGGAIRHVAQALDARRYRIVPVGAPNDDERGHPYLWRFWRDVPRLGGVTIFDRSWYGRVLVERVEGYAAPEDWQRAYAEIDCFERELVEAGAVVVKFWLHISRSEQLKRFRAREQEAFKRFKITPDDWRNRRKWPAYEQAIATMIARTGTAHAPWTLVEAEDKRHARLKVLRTIVERLDAALERKG
jgi:AMP-polyphosphate phosphotransferase